MENITRNKAYSTILCLISSKARNQACLLIYFIKNKEKSQLILYSTNLV